jgi:lycopene beta-cyclase
MKQPVEKLRGFFSAFFAVEQLVWSGFLAGWPGLPGNEFHDTWNARFSFALKLFVQMPNDVRLAMMLYAIQYTLEFGPATLLRSLTPGFLFGSGPADPSWQPAPVDIGDVDAKEEARRMMKEFTCTAHSTIHSKSDEEKTEERSETEKKVSINNYPAPFN